MKAVINNTLISKLTSQNNRYDVWDTKLAGFHVRAFPSGKKTYRCLYKRGKIMTIGSTELLTTTQAREKAKAILGDSAKGIAPLLESTKNKHLTLRQYLANEYTKWRQTNRKNGSMDIDRLRLHFIDAFGNTQLSNITQLDIEHWRSNRLKSGIKPATINRDINILKAALSKAVEWDIIETHPLAKLKPIQVDNITKVRFLSIDEENRLRQAIDNREHQLQIHRDSANKWRRDRKYKELPNNAHDHIKPMILLSLNTGVRQGELFELTWENVDLQRAVITIIGATAKSGKTRHIPLNSEALNALSTWQKHTNTTHGLVFPGKDGERFTNVTKSWKNLLQAANIHNFRWHDMRHHFASKLVMAGVDLNTVRELLGHSSMKMTLRYAHLAPEHKAQAVAKLLNR